MLRQVVILTAAALLLWVVADLVLLQPSDTAPAPQGRVAAQPPQTVAPPRSEAPAGFVADISLHTEAGRCRPDFTATPRG